MTATDPDTCKACGSSDLWGGFFDRKGYADTDAAAPGSRWAEVCNQCGQFQDKPIRRGGKASA